VKFNNAYSYESLERENLLKLLLKYGADVDAPDEVPYRPQTRNMIILCVFVIERLNVNSAESVYFVGVLVWFGNTSTCPHEYDAFDSNMTHISFSWSVMQPNNEDWPHSL
jgi:hypothetical protein